MQYTSSSENYSSSIKDSPSRWNSNKDDKNYMYKKSSYQYSNSGSNAYQQQHKPSDQNIDQLDALLEDLKNERQITRERELLPSTSYRTIERESGDPHNETITKTSRVIKSSKHAGTHIIPDDIETFSTSDYSTLKSTGYGGTSDTLKRDEYQRSDKLYGLGNSPSGNYESKSKVYDGNLTLNNTDLIPLSRNKTTTTTTTNLEELQNIALTDDILPVPGTKVTTTVRTYTYEIPAGTTTTNTNTYINRNTLQNNVAYSNVQQHESNISGYSQSHPPQPLPQPQSHPSVPQTVVYNTESYSTINKNSELPVVTNQSYELREHRESNTIRSPSSTLQPRNVPISPPGSNSQQTTVVYNINKTDNTHTMSEPLRYPQNTVRAPIVPHDNPPFGNSPPGPTTNRYFYKETSNVVNTIHGPNEPHIPPSQGHNIPKYPPPKQPLLDYPSHAQPPHGERYPPNTTTYSYKYSSSTTNNLRGPEHGSPSPNMPPAPFPVDGIEHSIVNGNPPQRVDDLMQSFGTTDIVGRNEIDSPQRKREIETAVASPNQQHVPSVNKAGKEVYYPPGHEMMISKREEMAAGSAAGGRWAKGSGNYEYESGYKSKTKTKSGGAMVPVCLPLCCAMPCSIM